MKLCPIIGHSDRFIEKLCQAFHMNDDLADCFRDYLAERDLDFDAFARRHRNSFSRSFLDNVLAGKHRHDHPALVRLRRLVAFEYDLQRAKLELGVSGRAIAQAAGISVSRLSRFERFLADLTLAEKRRIERFLAERTIERDNKQTIEGNKAVGRALRLARAGAGLTQAALAVEIGMERKSIIRWEQGSPMPDNVGSILEARLGLKLRP
jgi:transcriptional regulator with XRE-family HTH domain